MEIKVKKRNGNLTKFDFEKIYTHIKYAISGLDCDGSKIIDNFRLRIYDGISTKEIQRNLTLTIADLIDDENEDYQYAAARTYLQDLYKRLYNSFEPKLTVDRIKNQIKEGIYDSELFLYYTEDEVNELLNVIDFNKDKKFTYLGLTQMLKKYAIKRDGLAIESPQEIYFMISLYGFSRIKNKKERFRLVKKMYKLLSNFDIFLPTPDMVGFRTTMRGFTSCAGLATGDSIESIGNASKSMFKLITKLRAGIGIKEEIRGLGADIGKGFETHTGIAPYVKVFEGISKSSMQPNSGRSGSVTNYYPFFHWEIEDILKYKNNRGSDESSVRQSDHAIVMDKLILERLKEGKDITLFHLNEVPELFDLIGEDNFEEVYESYERKRNIKKKKLSADLFLKNYFNERYSTNRVYMTNANEMQRHSAFDLPTNTSNLCVSGDTKIKIRKITNKEESEIEIKDLTNIDYKQYEVFSYDTKTKQNVWRMITDFVMTNPKAKVMKITINNKSLIVTPDHKIWTENRGYVEVKNLKYNDIFILNGEEYNNFTLEQLEEEIPVYDITVEDTHNFYANNILIHNCTEINLPSFFSEDINLKVKDYNDFDNFIKELYDTGTWYQLYRYIYHSKIDDNNNEIVATYLSKLDKYGEDYKLNFGETFSCILGGVNFGTLSKDVEKRRKQIKERMEILVKFLDYKIDYQEYFGIDTFEKFTKNRRALGISPGNLFYLLAQYDYDYNSKEARELINDVMEEVLYYGIETSIELAKQLGKCNYFNDTKYSKGIFPNDTYNKNVDKLVSKENKLDWNTLKEEVKKYGMRNSTLLTAVPSSNSSRPANMISGLNAPKGLTYSVEDNKINVKGVLPDVSKYKEFYKRNLAFETDVIEYWKTMAVFQKWIDQAMSINENVDFTKYKDGKLPYSEVIKRLMTTFEYGLKSMYYVISRSDDHSKNDVLNKIEEEEGCEGGGCTL